MCCFCVPCAAGAYPQEIGNPKGCFRCWRMWVRRTSRAALQWGVGSVGSLSALVYCGWASREHFVVWFLCSCAAGTECVIDYVVCVPFPYSTMLHFQLFLFAKQTIRTHACECCLITGTIRRNIGNLLFINYMCAPARVVHKLCTHASAHAGAPLNRCPPALQLLLYRTDARLLNS